MSALLDVILPVFIVIGFGYAAARSGLFGEAAIDGIMRFAQTFALPVLLFRSISGLDLAAAFQPGLMISFYVGAFCGFAKRHPVAPDAPVAFAGDHAVVSDLPRDDFDCTFQIGAAVFQGAGAARVTAVAGRSSG